MKVLQVNNSDLDGRIFNGYDLNIALAKRGLEARQIVMNKKSETESVLQLEHDFFERECIGYMEERYCISNVLYPYADKLLQMEEFNNADIVHFHFPYHSMFSLLDYPRIMDERAVWTIHDLWPITGNCTHPMGCEGWKTGCGNCKLYNDYYFPMAMDNTRFMWELKKEVYKQINPTIVVSSQYMEDFIRKSPLTAHFTRIYRIPFGVNVFEKEKKTQDKIVIGIRADDSLVKGCNFFYEAIRNLGNLAESLVIETIGTGKIPEDIYSLGEVYEHGWILNRKKYFDIISQWDIFVMPSLAESFGLMAIEAMASGCAVLCFENTAVASVTGAPYTAACAKYMDSLSLAEQMEALVSDRGKLRDLQFQGKEYVKKHYTFESYVNSHIELYKCISGKEI